MNGHRDLELVGGASVACALVALLVPVEVLRVIAALPLALLFTGYAITAATFASHPLDRARTLLLSLALSLAVLALSALPLNYVPGGITDLSWAVLLIVVVLGSCRAAAVRRPAASGQPLLVPRPRPSWTDGLLLGGGAVAAVAALVLAMTPVGAKNAVGYTELWLSPTSTATAAGVNVGVASQEQEPVAYRLRVRLANQTRPVVRDFALAPGERRLLHIASAVPAPGAPVPVAATLRRRDRADTVYRRVAGWIPSPDTSR